MKRADKRKAKLRFGLRVLEERDARKLTQEQLAVLARMSRRQISRIEAGIPDTPLSTILAIIEAMGIQPGSLFLPPSPATIRRVGRPKKKTTKAPR